MPVVDLEFPVSGKEVPRDHGYSLYGALCRSLPQLHGAAWLGVHPLSGGTPANGSLLLRRSAALRLRIPAERIPDLLPLAGRELDVSGRRIRLGVPRVHALVAAATLDSRLVVIKLTAPPTKAGPEDGRETLDTAAFAERYCTEIARQLSRMEVEGNVVLCGRQRIAVAGKRIVGFSVRVGSLEVEASLRLQERGLGGKRTMGCGIFRPTRSG